MDFEKGMITIHSRRVNQKVEINKPLEKVLKKFKEEAKGHKYLFERVNYKETLNLFRYIQKMLIKSGFGDIGHNLFKRFSNDDDDE